MWKKICIVGITIYFVLSLSFIGVQTIRLERSMAECEQYRTELAKASDREHEIGESLSRTGEILSSTISSVADLRKVLKEVEDSYNDMYRILCSNSNSIIDNEVKKNAKER